MDDFGDIFYIVVLVAAALGSVVKSFGKKNAKRGESAPQSDEPEDEWTADEAETPFPEYEFVPQADLQPEPVELENEPQPEPAPQPFAEGERTVQQHAAPAVAPPDEPTAPVIDFTDLDEVKRAVVASEILNRKHC